VITKTVECASPEEARALADKVMAQARKQGFSEPTKIEKTMDDFAAEVEDMINGLAEKRGEVRQRTEAEAKKALAEAEEIADGFEAVCGFGRGESGLANPTEADAEVLRELAANGELARFVKMIGRFLDRMKETRTREKVEGIHAIRGIENTADVRRLVPSEFALMGLRETRDLQTARLAEGKLTGYRRTSMGAKASGPVCILLDWSGSMDTSGGPQGWTIARAFAVASALFAADNRREVTFCWFGNSVREIADLDLSSPEGRVAFVKTVMRQDAFDGTRYDALMAYLRDRNLPPATDILLISDGADGGVLNRPEWNALTREYFATRDLAYIVIGGVRDAAPLLVELAGPRCVIGQNLLADSRAAEVAAAALQAK
jgi:uncharacterized protein with von Willebrand factor type A (vWA) domain